MGPVPTLRGLRFVGPWAERGVSDRTLFSLLGSMTDATLSELSSRPLSWLHLLGKVAGGDLKSRRADLVDTGLFKREKSVKVIGGGFRLFFFKASQLPAGAEGVLAPRQRDAESGLLRRQPRFFARLRGRGRKGS